MTTTVQYALVLQRIFSCGMKHEMQSSSIAVSTFHFVDAFPFLNVDACNERKLHSKVAMERAVGVDKMPQHHDGKFTVKL